MENNQEINDYISEMWKMEMEINFPSREKILFYDSDIDLDLNQDWRLWEWEMIID